MNASRGSRSVTPARPRMWRCPTCGRRFANRRQTHFCGRHDLEHHFARKSDGVRALFAALVALFERAGPVIVIPEKTRIAFQVRMSFAAVAIRRTYIVGHLVLARRIDHPRFVRVDTISPRNQVHVFRLASVADLDRQFAAWAREARAVGEQKHLDGGPNARR